MSTTRSDRLAELLAQTQAALENAYSGNWEQVISDEPKRRRLMTVLFSEPMDVREAVEHRSAIEEVLSLNKKLERATADARDHIRSEADALSKGRHAVNTYTKIAD